MTQDNIKSSTVELGFELAKEFLKKLISPSVEELGLLLSDKIKYLRFRNQVAILNKAENLVKQKGIRIKEIPVKILVPLLENASLEEDKDLQSNWAKMVANLADSKSNLQNQIFPYLLSQISKEELNGLREILVMEDEQITNINRVNELFNREDVENYEREESHLRTKVNLNEQKGFLCYLELFQYSNLERLGLIKQTPPGIFVKKIEGFDMDADYYQDLIAEYNMDDFGYRITELGEMFLKICD